VCRTAPNRLPDEGNVVFNVGAEKDAEGAWEPLCSGPRDVVHSLLRIV